MAASKPSEAQKDLGHVKVFMPSILDSLVGGAASVVGQFLDASTKGHLCADLCAEYGENMGRGLREMLNIESKAVRAKCEVYRVLATPLLDTNPEAMTQLYKYLQANRYEVGKYVMMLDANTPNKVLIGLVKVYKSYGNAQLDVPLHALFAFAPAVVMKLTYLTRHFNKRYFYGQETRPSEYWLGFGDGFWQPDTWIVANNAGPDSSYLKKDQNGKPTNDLKECHQYAEADSKEYSKEPWDIPPLAKLLAELPCSDGDNSGGLARMLRYCLHFKDYKLEWENSKWVRFGNDWTKADLDTVLQKSADIRERSRGQ